MNYIFYNVLSLDDGCEETEGDGSVMCFQRGITLDLMPTATKCYGDHE